MPGGKEPNIRPKRSSQAVILPWVVAAVFYAGSLLTNLLNYVSLVRRPPARLPPLPDPSTWPRASAGPLCSRPSSSPRQHVPPCCLLRSSPGWLEALPWARGQRSRSRAPVRCHESSSPPRGLTIALAYTVGLHHPAEPHAAVLPLHRVRQQVPHERRLPVSHLTVYTSYFDSKLLAPKRASAHRPP